MIQAFVRIDHLYQNNLLPAPPDPAGRSDLAATLLHCYREHQQATAAFVPSERGAAEMPLGRHILRTQHALGRAAAHLPPGPPPPC